MNPVADQAAAIGRSQLEAALKLSEITAEGLEKLISLQAAAIKEAVGGGIEGMRKVASVKDVSELTTLSAGWATPAWEKAQAYAKGAYEAISSSQAAISSLVEQQMTELNKSVASALDNALKSAPAGSEAVVSALKSALQSSSAVYESVIKATKQAGATAEANLAAITPTVAKKKATA